MFRMKEPIIVLAPIISILFERKIVDNYCAKTRFTKFGQTFDLDLHSLLYVTAKILQERETGGKADKQLVRIA